MSASPLTNFNRHSLRRRGISRLWQTLPAISIFLLLLPAGLPKHVTTLTEILPPLPLLAIFCWGLMRHERVGYPLVFAAGLIQDALTSMPFGSSALLWVLFRYLVMTQGKDIREQGFVGAWVSFSLLLLAVLAVQWVLMGYYYRFAMPLAPAVMQWLLGTLLYPGMHALLHRTERHFHRRYWHLLKVTG